MSSAQCQKPSTTVEVIQPKNQHSSLGQKISEITSKAFKGHHARASHTQVESHGNGALKTETHYYGQTQNHQEKKHGVSKTHITVTLVQAQITQTIEDDIVPTRCFGPHHAKRNGELNNKKEFNLFQRIKNGMSRHNNEGSSSSSSDSDTDNEKRSKTSATKSTTPKALSHQK